jgi:aminopeptidase-like protein
MFDISASEIFELIDSNRTIVSSGSRETVSKLLKFTERGKVLNFQSGLDSSNWLIPENWEILDAKLIDLSSNKIILSIEDSILFIAPYSKSCDVILSKMELMDITLSDPNNPNDFKYQHRLAYDSARTLKETLISIPWKILQSLDENGKFQLVVKVKSEPGNMQIFQAATNNEEKDKVFLLSHYCHSGQLNDGLAGVYVMGRVFLEICKNPEKFNHNYVWLAFPETIGSSVYISNFPEILDQAYFSIFSEMPGAKSSIRITNSRRKSTYIDRLVKLVLESRLKEFSFVDFKQGWGNDEMVFDAPLVGIPSISIDRAPFNHYHLSSDTELNFSIDSAEEVVNLIYETLVLFERDYIPCPNYFVPPQLSRLGLYKDWSNSRSAYIQNMNLLDAATGQESAVDIAIRLGLEIDKVFEFYDTLIQNGLVTPLKVDPRYARRVG